MKDFGYWFFGRHGFRHVIVEDGIFRVYFDIEHWRVQNNRKNQLAFKRRLADRYFGNREFLIGLRDDFVNAFLLEADGKTESEVREIAEKFVRARKERQTQQAEFHRKWNELRKKWDGMIIGIDSSIDVYDTGFSVRVLFGSDVGFLGRRKFLQENRIEFLRWVIHELSESKNAKRKIGDVRFYKPVEIVNLRANEVEVKFEVKEVV